VLGVIWGKQKPEDKVQTQVSRASDFGANCQYLNPWMEGTKLLSREGWD